MTALPEVTCGVGRVSRRRGSPIALRTKARQVAGGDCIPIIIITIGIVEI